MHKRRKTRKKGKTRDGITEKEEEQRAIDRRENTT